MGLILLILPLIKVEEKRAIVSDKNSIGTSAKGSKEKAKPKDKVLATSKFATTEMASNSIDATIKEIEH